MNDYLLLALEVAVIGGIFGICWKKGYIQRLAAYWQETVVELNKCAWPSAEELKGSTAVIMVTIALLGAFIVVVDFAILMFIKAIMPA